MKRRLNAAVIGGGWAGKIHAEAYANHPEVNLIAICDPNLEKARQLAERLNCRAYESLEALLEKEKIEMASIASPTETHISLGKKLLQAGVAVLCEKPLSRDAASAFELCALAKSYALSCGVNYNRRFAKGYQIVKERLKQAKRVHFVSSILAQNVPVAQTKDLRAQLPQDFLVFDALSHQMDLMVYLVGKPAHLFALGSKDDPDQLWTDIEVMISFENGTLGNLICSLHGPEWGQLPIERFEVATETERLVVENIVARVEWFGYRDGEYHVWEPNIFEPTNYIESMYASINAWIESVLHGSPPPISAEEGAFVVELCEQVKKALKSLGDEEKQ